MYLYVLLIALTVFNATGVQSLQQCDTDKPCKSRILVQNVNNTILSETIKTLCTCSLVKETDWDNYQRVLSIKRYTNNHNETHQYMFCWDILSYDLEPCKTGDEPVHVKSLDESFSSAKFNSPRCKCVDFKPMLSKSRYRDSRDGVYHEHFVCSTEIPNCRFGAVNPCSFRKLLQHHNGTIIEDMVVSLCACRKRCSEDWADQDTSIAIDRNPEMQQMEHINMTHQLTLCSRDRRPAPVCNSTDLDSSPLIISHRNRNYNPASIGEEAYKEAMIDDIECQCRDNMPMVLYRIIERFASFDEYFHCPDMKFPHPRYCETNEIACKHRETERSHDGTWIRSLTTLPCLCKGGWPNDWNNMDQVITLQVPYLAQYYNLTRQYMYCGNVAPQETCLPRNPEHYYPVHISFNNWPDRSPRLVRWRCRCPERKPMLMSLHDRLGSSKIYYQHYVCPFQMTTLPSDWECGLYISDAWRSLTGKCAPGHFCSIERNARFLELDRAFCKPISNDKK